MHSKTPLVESTQVDSIIYQYDHADAIQNIQKELEFWRQRISSTAPDMTNSVRYAQILHARFLATGDLRSLQESDSILSAVATRYAFKDAGPYPGLIRNAITMHSFPRADSLLHKARLIGLRRYEAAALTFDVQFERGQFPIAALALQEIASDRDFGYQFRKARWKHYQGNIDSGIAAMESAVQNAGENNTLWQTAMSNLADLHLHAGNAKKAYEEYSMALTRNPSDLHSIMGIGWIALMHDRNDSIAEKIFTWAVTKTSLPDPILKLMAVAEFREDDVAIAHFARQFVQQATAPAYGGMYNKYLIPIYADILKEPVKAVAIAKAELANRNTPQTQSWLAYALLKQGEQDAAEKIYKENISGNPLEGLEQFYMAMLTHATGNQFAAGKYIQYAKENGYDLSPGMIKKLDSLRHH
jgi:tetratricopeptide (TPR) repeat protein